MSVSSQAAGLLLAVLLPVRLFAAQAPYPGPEPHPLPGAIEAEAYDRGGPGEAYHDQSEGNAGKELREDDVDLAKGGSGHLVGWTADGEWLEYTVSAEAGRYDLVLHAALGRGDAGRLRVLFDEQLLAEIDVPKSGSFPSAPPIVVEEVELPSKEGILRLEIERGGFNLDTIRFLPRERTVEEKSRLITALEAFQPQKVILYGTSLSARYGGSFIREMERRYQGFFEGRNSARASMASDWGLENLEERVLAHRPDAVLLEFAINDAFLPREISVDQARANLETMIDRILAVSPHGEIILLNLIPPIGSPREQRPELDDYYAMVAAVARERGLTFIDVHAEFERILEEDPDRFSELVPDDIHPNRSGSEQVIVPTILEALGAEPGW